MYAWYQALGFVQQLLQLCCRVRILNLTSGTLS